MQSHMESSPSAPRLMAIFAHPDDETFGVAGTMFRAVNRGYPVAVVSATRGEAGEIADPALATRENLGQVRERELRAACAAVGVSDVSFLDYIDGQLAAADPTEATGRVVRVIRRFRPDVVVTFAANGLYGHPDHMAIHRLVVAAIPLAAESAAYPEQFAAGLEPHRVAKVYFQGAPREELQKIRAQAQARGEDFIPGGNAATIPVEDMGTPWAQITTRVTLTDAEFRAKVLAMRAHATQLAPTSPFAQADESAVRAFAGTEFFELVPPPLSLRAYPTPEEDLFAGLV